MARSQLQFISGRIAALPTIWSNCMAGWWLADGGRLDKLPFVLAGTTLIHLGAELLKDAFAAQRMSAERDRGPGAVPGTSTAPNVNGGWIWGLAGIGLGTLCLIGMGTSTAALGFILAIFTLLLRAFQETAFAPVLAGTSRMLVVVTAASAALSGVTGWAVWSGLALGFYVAGLSCFDWQASRGRALPYWPLILMSIPIALALILNADGYRNAAILASTILALWIVRSLRPAFWSSPPRPRATIDYLVAGIPLVDLVAVAPAPLQFRVLFLGLFILTLLLQSAGRESR